MQVLSTRIYRGQTPPGADSGIEFVSFGGVATLVRAEVHEMGSAWEGMRWAAQQAKQATVPAGAGAGASSRGASLQASPRYVLHPPAAAATEPRTPPPPGISEEEFRAVVAAAMGEAPGTAAARQGGWRGSRAASPRGPSPMLGDEVLLCVSPHAAAY
jgi:hypothetical protein